MILLLMQKWCITGWAQLPSFDHLTVENGLSQNSVLAIAQDSRGFLWLGTGHGATRYDGSRCKVYTFDPHLSRTLSNNYILCLLNDDSHHLWVGSAAGLDEYCPETDDFRRELKGTEVHCLFQDSRGCLWAGTRKGLYQRDRGQDSFHIFSDPASLAGSDVRAIGADAHGDLWIGTTTGLTRMKRGSKSLQFDTFRHREGDPSSLSENYITALVEDGGHNLWIGTQDSGIDLYHPGTGSFSKALTGNLDRTGLNGFRIRQMMRDRLGKIWIGTQEGLLIFNPLTKAFDQCRNAPLDRRTLAHNSVYSVFEDAAGSVWVGTYFGGVSVSYPHITEFRSLQDSGRAGGLSSNIISGINRDSRGRLWLSTEGGGGLNVVDSPSGRITVYKNRTGDPFSLSSNRVKCVYRDRDGNMWLGTNGGGLNVYDPSRNGFLHYLDTSRDPLITNSEIASIVEDGQGRFWVGTMDGLKVFRRKGTTLVPLEGVDRVNVPVKVVFEDSKQRIWTGTGVGLYLLKKDSASFAPVAGLSTAYVNCIAEDSRGNLWIGLDYGGLARLDAVSGKISIYTDKQGLPNNNVVSLQVDGKDNLWMGTGNGLSKLDTRSYTFHNFTTSDGLPGNAFNYRASAVSPGGELYFGGYSGLVSFYPEKMEINDLRAPLVFTGFRLFNAPVAIRGKDGLLSADISLLSSLRLAYNQDVFSVDFALLNFIKPDKNTYAYKLEGLDKDWTETGHPTITYIHLPAGTYTLLVKGANNDGIWSTPAALRITVLPPFWRTWWAYVFYVLLLAAVLFGITRFFFLRALLKKEAALHQVKLNFFTNISHEIRTHLSLISGPVEHLLSRNKDVGAGKQLMAVKKNADRLLRLVSEQMDFRKAETGHLKLQIVKGDLVSFLQEIYASFQDISLSRRIKASFVSEFDSEEIYFDREQLEKVFFNLLSNAYKFTPDGGSVGILVKRQRSAVEVRVTDNGKGIAPENVEKIFTNYYQEDDKTTQNTGYGIGLALAKSIVELHHGTLVADSQAGSTTFTVTLPAGSAGLRSAEDVSAGRLIGQGTEANGPAARDNGQSLMEKSQGMKENAQGMKENGQGVKENAQGVKENGQGMKENAQGMKENGVAAEVQGPAMETTGQGMEAMAAAELAEAVMEAGQPGDYMIGDTGPAVLPERPFSVLLVEDNTEVRAFLQETLSGQYHILESINGLRGWESAIENIPDVIISDVMMPEMDGLTLCHRLKTDPRTSHIPVILLTARSSSDHQVSGLEMGADIYLTKPFSVRVLTLHIRNLLVSRERMRRQFAVRFQEGGAAAVQPETAMAGPAKEQLPGNSLAGPVDEQFLKDAIRVVDEYLDDPEFGVAKFAIKMAMSPPVLYKKLKAVTDMSVNDFIKSLRLQKAHALVRAGDADISNVAYQVGYKDGKYFMKEYRKRFGS